MPRSSSCSCERETCGSRSHRTRGTRVVEPIGGMVQRSRPRSRRLCARSQRGKRAARAECVVRTSITGRTSTCRGRACRLRALPDEPAASRRRVAGPSVSWGGLGDVDIRGKTVQCPAVFVVFAEEFAVSAPNDIELRAPRRAPWSCRRTRGMNSSRRPSNAVKGSWRARGVTGNRRVACAARPSRTVRSTELCRARMARSNHDCPNGFGLRRGA